MSVINAALRESSEHRPNPTGDHNGETRASTLANLLGKHVMTTGEARKYATDRALAAGLDEDSADAVMHRSMEVWHPEFTVREFANFVDQEIQHVAQP